MKEHECYNCKKITKNPKFCCMSCAGIYNNKLFPKKTRTLYYCLECGKGFFCGHKEQIYCCQNCAVIGKYNKRINHIEQNSTFLYNNKKDISSTRFVRRYLIDKHGNNCVLCGQSADNWHNKPLTLIVDHIDGHSNNWCVDNIRLVCPNCDSQLPTFKARNKGNSTRKYTIKQKTII
jgi:hypothetical protein